ncbi:uncharacterized protein C8R40DRAFT_1172914 [Lentinula edodes]|uniref:uncharacterized protein n=1 Tax=Lentinula edodes TaxID=5353 RepID=UPI001E8EA6EF|nr:uncharacterized protein C8R40DRAFT_1172914 [Lentinula edodes]KAH7873284.1 hypothetical protein C8R40DRAFT_1172914 [Lentinula edodes]
MHTPLTPTHQNGHGHRHHSPARPNGKHSHSDPPTHGLRAQLHNLLPRHSLFHAHIHIHQISSVPLVHGEFAARWKFKNVQSQTGLLKRVKGKRRGSQKDEKGKAKEVVDEGDDSFGSGEAAADRHSSSSNSIVDDQNVNIPAVVVSGYMSPTAAQPKSPYQELLNPPRADFSRTSSALTSSSASYSHSGSSANLPQSLSITPITSNSAPPTPSTAGVESYSNTRGMTPFYKLKDHAVVWDHDLDVIIKMDIDRETSELLPNEFKLVVMQRVIPGDPDAPRNPRLGALYLDLSEYAGVGKEVTRTYLLRDTKMNATVKLTIYLEHSGGDTNYIAPLLPKAEIFNGVADLLDDDVYITRPRALDLWGPYHNQQELEMDLLGGTSIPELQSAAAEKSRSKSRVRARSKSRLTHTRIPSNGKNSMISAEDMNSDADFYIDEDDSDIEESRYEVPFDVSRLPLAYGPKTTEMLIEAIFNPVRVTHHDLKGNPFTYYVSPEEVREEQARKLERLRDKDRTVRAPYLGNESPSLYSADDNSSHSGYTENSEVGRGRSGMRGWWSSKKKTPAAVSSTPTGSSRPGTPGTPVAVR